MQFCKLELNLPAAKRKGNEFDPLAENASRDGAREMGALDAGNEIIKTSTPCISDESRYGVARREAEN